MLGYIILGIVIAIVVIFLLVLFVRTVRFKPEKEAPVEAEDIQVNREKIVDDMVSMIQCKTISARNPAHMDMAEFEKFQKLLEERYPLVHKHFELKKLGLNGLLYYMKGKSSNQPSVCMSHYDVVPVDEGGWEKPAFGGIVENGEIWGRGTLDTKCSLLAIMEAAEQLLAEGYVPEQDLYFSFSGEEEVDGRSCDAIVSYFKERGITPAFVLDEGGAVVDNVFPGVKEACAMIGIAEKGSVNVNFTMKGNGGHASAPPSHTLLGELSQAVTAIEAHPFKCQFTKPVLELFDTMGRHSTFFYRMIFANLWIFAPVLDRICKKAGGELNAMLRTTAAVTKMEGSKAYNVLPSTASFGVNMRLLGEDTTESAIAYLKQIIKNDRVEVQAVNRGKPSIVSDTNCVGWDKLKLAIRKTWPEALVSPYLMVGGTDASYYCKITDKIYRFSPMQLTDEEMARIHGHNERVSVDNLVKMVQFYVRMLKLL